MSLSAWIFVLISMKFPLVRNFIWLMILTRVAVEFAVCDLWLKCLRSFQRFETNSFWSFMRRLRIFGGSFKSNQNNIQSWHWGQSKNIDLKTYLALREYYVWILNLKTFQIQNQKWCSSLQSDLLESVLHPWLAPFSTTWLRFQNANLKDFEQLWFTSKTFSEKIFYLNFSFVFHGNGCWRILSFLTHLLMTHSVVVPHISHTVFTKLFAWI